MNKGKLNKKIVITLGVACVLSLFVVQYLLLIDIKNKNEKFDFIKNELSDQTEKRNHIDSMQKMLQDSNSDISLLNGSIVQSDGDVKFIESLESMAQKNGLEIKMDSLSVEEDKTLSKGGLVFLKIKASVKGGWSGMYSFLTQLESMPFKIRIDNFFLSSGLAESPDGAPDGAKAVSAGRAWQSSIDMRVLKYKNSQ